MKVLLDIVTLINPSKFPVQYLCNSLFMNSLVKAIIIACKIPKVLSKDHSLYKYFCKFTFVTTLTHVIKVIIGVHSPIPGNLLGTGRLVLRKSFHAKIRNCKVLLMKA